MRLSYTRFWELVPATLVWTTFIGAVVLSFFWPLAVIYFIIAFDLYWVTRVTHFVFYLALSYQRYKKAQKTDWFAKLQTLEKNYQDYYHMIFLPTYKEPIEVLETTFQSLLDSNYPKDKMIVILGGEGRDEENFLKNAEIIKEKFADKFYKLLITVHPDGLEGELAGKGANAHWMGHRSKELVDQMGLDYEKIIVSYFDCDTCAHPEYFAHLTYRYLTHKNPTKAAFQPAVLYNNNIWESPAPMRITAFGTVFWLFAELMRPERMYTFSSHSIGYQALVDVNFWQKDIVTDDSRIFLQCFFRYHGNFEVVPLYIPVSMDTVIGDSYWQGMKNLYKQQRRWAWGIEHLPYMMEKFRKNKMIPWWRKMKYLFNLAEGMYSWATAPILIFVLGHLPLWVATFHIESSSVIVQNTPYVLQWLMRAAMAGILVSAILSIGLLPKKPKSDPKHKYLIMLLQWLLLPITLILFGSIPAVEAQTRLALGKKYHLGFWVTPKARR